jgi:hypothetical protein
LNEQPLKFALERAKVGDLPLAFPGKVLADAATNGFYFRFKSQSNRRHGFKRQINRNDRQRQSGFDRRRFSKGEF